MGYYVVCKGCSSRIPVSSSGDGMINVGSKELNIGPGGKVRGKGVSIGPGGGITFGPNSTLELGDPPPSQFKCRDCGHTDTYRYTEILSD